MSLNNNAISMKLAERKKLAIRFRELYSKLDVVIEALYRPGLYSVTEYDQLAYHYRSLQLEADRLEEQIRKYFPHNDLEEKIKWMKSNPCDSKTATLFVESPGLKWDESKSLKNLKEQEEEI